MQIRLTCVLTFFIATQIPAQNVKSIEINIAGRYDKHADYTTRYFNRSYTDDTKLSGGSFGLNFNYIQPVYRNLKIKIGIGYYGLGIDKIRQTTPFNLTASGRNIEYRHPLGILPLFATTKYHYDNLDLAAGLIYKNKFLKEWYYTLSADFSYLYTFSQLYHITYDDIKYKTNNAKTLGFQVNSFIGALKNIIHYKYYLSPKLIVPVYQRLNGDKKFGEDENVKMRKWFNGIGLEFSIGKYLK